MFVASTSILCRLNPHFALVVCWSDHLPVMASPHSKLFKTDIGFGGIWNVFSNETGDRGSCSCSPTQQIFCLVTRCLGRLKACYQGFFYRNATIWQSNVSMESPTTFMSNFHCKLLKLGCAMTGGVWAAEFFLSFRVSICKSLPLLDTSVQVWICHSHACYVFQVTPTCWQRSIKSLKSGIQVTSKCYQRSKNSVLQVASECYQRSTKSGIQVTSKCYQRSIKSVLQVTSECYQRSTKSVFQDTSACYQRSTKSVFKDTSTCYQRSTKSVFQVTSTCYQRSIKSVFQVTSTWYQRSIKSVFQVTSTCYQRSIKDVVVRTLTFPPHPTPLHSIYICKNEHHPKRTDHQSRR